MSRHQGVEDRPRDYLAPGATWPDGPLRAGAPPEAVLVLSMSKKFRDAYEVRKVPRRPGQRRRPSEHSLQGLAERAGLSKTTVHNFLKGKTWPDTLTVDRLERVFGVRLWNWEHWPPPKR